MGVGLPTLLLAKGLPGPRWTPACSRKGLRMGKRLWLSLKVSGRGERQQHPGVCVCAHVCIGLGNKGAAQIWGTNDRSGTKEHFPQQELSSSGKESLILEQALLASQLSVISCMLSWSTSHRFQWRLRLCKCVWCCGLSYFGSGKQSHESYRN